MSRSLTIGVLCSNFPPESTGGRVFEEEVLNAALAIPTRHKLVVYPGGDRIEDTITNLGVGHRVSTMKLLRKPLIPKRVLRRAARTVLRREKPLPYAELTAALRKQGVDALWMLGGTLAPLDIPYIATIWDLQHRVQPWFPEVSQNDEWRTRENLYEAFVKRAAGLGLVQRLERSSCVMRTAMLRMPSRSCLSPRRPSHSTQDFVRGTPGLPTFRGHSSCIRPNSGHTRIM